MSFVVVAKSLALALAFLAAFLRPAVGASYFRKVEGMARRAARHRVAAWLAVGLLVLLVRGALLPLWPIPKPTIFDEFGYILQADTFAHGRLTNPPHPLWHFFESAYVLVHPTYQAKYPPGQALAMATGQTLFGDPWFGVWLSCGLMAAALVWALQGWLPPGWALFGGLMALPLAIDSYWMNSYWGGAVSAVGGALVLGGYARVVKQSVKQSVKRRQVWYALAVGIGIAILANTRPYEGLVFTIPVGVALLFSRKWGAIAIVAAVLIPAFAVTGYYNRTVTGSALQMPFTEYARQYATIPLFNFQPLQPAKAAGTAAMQDLHQNWEVEEWRKARSLELVRNRLDDWKAVAATFLGSLLMGLPLLVFLGNVGRDRRTRLPLICVAAALAGSLIEIRYYQHYAGPATAAVLIVAVQGFRHLRYWRPDGKPVGRFLSRAIPLLVVCSVVVSQAQLIRHPESQPVNSIRDRTIALLSDLEPHVIVVRYTSSKNPHEEWVYNGADIDSQGVIWVHDLGAIENARLREYYKDRKIWLFQPDINPYRLDPYQ